MAAISVIGTGYLGATHAAALAESGHTVVGIDTDSAKAASLAAGVPPFHEPGLADLVARNVAAGRLRFTDDYRAAGEASIHFLCVGTPQLGGSDAADLSQVDAALDALCQHADPGSLIAGKSTVPVGTAARLLTRLRESGGPALVWNPEFLREGFAVADTLRPDRIVIGAADPAAARPLLELYRQQLDAGTPLVLTDLATAELVKVSANAFLATKISFINAMADVCEASGADVRDLADALGHDDRIGRKFLGAGIGFGGGCLPKDLRAFLARGEELGVARSISFLREVDAVNQRRRDRIVQAAADLLAGKVFGARIAVLGAAFKPDSDDVRESPALHIAAAMQLQGADVVVYDPEAMANAARAFPTLTFAPDLDKTLADADLVLLLTEWQQFLSLDPRAAGRLVRSRLILDGRNALPEQAWRAAGWHYRGIGIA
jgi:UDPglucose 6-dehydrogenase